MNNEILPIISSRIDKKLYNFNFPSIENNIRDVEPIEVIITHNIDTIC